MKFTTLILATVATIATIVCPSSAQTLTFNAEQLLVVASAAPGSSFLGSDYDSLTIDQDSNDYGAAGVSHALLRFNDFQAPVGAIVRSAHLSFFTSSATDGPVDFYGMAIDWTSTATWGSLGGDGLTPGVETLPVAGGSMVDIGEGSDVNINVTAIVAEWLRGSPNYGFGIINQSGDGWDVRTRDSADGMELAPRLTVEFTSPPPLTLEVDPETGYARFLTTLGSDVASVTLTSYEVRTAGAPFDAAAWRGSNLSAHGIDAIDPAAEGMRWETVADTSQQLIESYLLGGSDLLNGETLPIGKLLPDSSGETPLTVNYVVNIDYVDPATADLKDVLYTEDIRVTFQDVPRAGDYNADGVIDAADYTVWRDQVGDVGADLRADGNENGEVDSTDYQLWRANYGANVGPANSSQVPEPGTFAISIVVSLLGAVAIQRGTGGSTKE